MLGIHIVIDGNKAHTASRKHHLKVFSCFNVFPTQTREILYDNTINPAFINCRHDSLKAGTIIIRSGITIVIRLINKADVRLILQIGMHQFTLICDAVALLPPNIHLGQAVVPQRAVFLFCFLHDRLKRHKRTS